jgi:hypothetical protein
MEDLHKYYFGINLDQKKLKVPHVDVFKVAAPAK